MPPPQTPAETLLVMPGWRCLGGVLLLGAAASAFAATAPQAPEQTLPEFLDELSDNALSADRDQLYRVDGRRRYVRLGSKWIAVLDEQAAVRLGSTGVGPATAGPPGKALAFLNTRDKTRSRLYVQDDSTGREVGASVNWMFLPDWTLRTQAYRLRDSSTGILRHDAEAALRYGPQDLWIEAMLRHVELNDEFSTQTWVNREPSANFGGLRAFWRASDTLSFSAQMQRAIRPEMLPSDERLVRPRTEFAAEYKPRFEGALAGLRLYWREATRLGLLASQGVDERSTYRSVFGASVPDGSPEGTVYTEMRRHGLTNEGDALWVLGWRHSLQPAPQWRVNTTLEAAEPVDGTTAIRSNTVGISVTQSAHPSHNLLLETEAVHTSLAHSSYVGAKYTNRFTENSLTAWRLSVTDSRPKDATSIGTTHLKASVGWGWREPEARDLYTLWRYTLLGRNAHGPYTTLPDVADRIAHIVSGQVGYELNEHRDMVLRASQRWDRDESFNGGAMRTSRVWVLRGSQNVGERWVLSAHAATLGDSAGPRQNGLGAEVGYRISRKVALAIGYNFKGFDDSELELDDKLKKGVQVRLRFAIDAALSRWLDPPMPGRAAAPEAVPLE